MKEQRITIEIDRHGQITADAEGFSGDACLEELDRLLEGLSPGAATMDRKPDAKQASRRRIQIQSTGKNS